MRKPDVKGPRFREKRISILTVDTLKKLKKKYPEYKDLNIQEFKKIIMTYNSILMQGVLNNRNGIELPEGLGFIFMGSCPPPKVKNIDYKKTIENGAEVTYRNWDSDNRLLKIFYTNTSAKIPFHNKQVWAFKATKDFRKMASESFKKNWSKYIEVLPTQKVSMMFNRAKRSEFQREQNINPTLPEGYDEFKM